MAQTNPLTKDLVVSIVDFLLRQREDKANTPSANFLGMAVTCLEKVYDIQPADYRRQGATPPLEELFRRAKEPVSVRKRREVEMCKERGNALMKKGKCEEAVQEYSKAIAIDRFNVVCLCNRAAAFIQLGQYRVAVEDCIRAQGYDKRYIKAYARMGQATWLMGQPEKAIKIFKKGLTVEPNNVNLLKSLRLLNGSDLLKPMARIKYNMRRLASNLKMLRHDNPLGWKYQAFEGETTEEEKSEALRMSEPLD